MVPIFVPQAVVGNIRLYTINGKQAAHITLPEPAHTLAVTTMMEGRFVNLVAAISNSLIT